MKVLLDMNISPEWVSHFQKAGFECSHWSVKGNPAADDRDIFAWAAANGYIVVTHDLDFGAILAATNAKAPSVIQIRMKRWLPEDADAHRIVHYVGVYTQELKTGVLITVEVGRHKIRIRQLKYVYYGRTFICPARPAG